MHNIIRIWKIFMILRTISHVRGENPREIILTPHSFLQVNGKTLYYTTTKEILIKNPKNTIPWEHTLKYLIYNILQGNLNKNSRNSNLEDYEIFRSSPYIQSNENIQKFGDIITIAKGRVEHLSDNKYIFKEGNCYNFCNNNESKVLAFWTIQKIRHRDENHKYRYELKFIIDLNLSNKSDTKREIKNYTTKSFILKDNDYPKSFNELELYLAERQNDLNKINFPHYNKISQLNNLKDITNINFANNLNVGEKFYDKGTKISTNIKTKNINFPTPTTYRPNYHKKIPILQYKNTQKVDYLEGTKNYQAIWNSSVLHSLNKPHQLNQRKIDNGNIIYGPRILFSNPQVFTYAPIANQIPMPPNFFQYPIVRAPYAIPITSQPNLFNTTLTLKSSTEDLLNIKNHFEPIKGNVFITEKPKTKFKPSPILDEIHFSEPDPLYSNGNGINSENFYKRTPYSNIPINNNTEDNEHKQKNYFLNFYKSTFSPWNETTTFNEANVIEKPRDHSIEIETVTENINLRSSTVSNYNSKIFDSDSKKSYSEVYKIQVHTTSEKPTLKWKQNKLQITEDNGQISSYIEDKISTTEKSGENIKAFVENFGSSTKDNKTKVETKFSVSSSISFKIGNNTEEKLVTSKDKIHQLEMIKANFKINTNKNDKNIQVYKLNKTSESEKIEHKNLTESILENVKKSIIIN